ncbi:TDP-N-acetylfucosamine:lipid II N-acetylfucosaminyltransferase [Aeromonas veronii]|uniref:TDP-N-acetylfucosamine:lipid II N-acetylfucosaminyltransferase n=1 Tax=Aeromonas veronii TaxID=654 RepID=UPI003D193D56
MNSFILHVMISEKFMPGFIDFVRSFSDRVVHRYVMITSEKYEYGLSKDHGVEFLHQDRDFERLLSYMIDADKIILHGLWRDKVCSLLMSHDYLYAKTYWVMWGGDFYHPEYYSDAQRHVMKNVCHLIAMTDDSISFVRDKYGATGEHIRCVVYPSNIVNTDILVDNTHRETDDIKILVGNSSTEANNHISVYERLHKQDSNKLKIYSVLSYPIRHSYADSVVARGTELFGDRFTPILHFMSYDKYLAFLSKVDVALFDSWRQQGIGNIVQLLSMGARVYIRKRVSTWGLCQVLGLKVFDIEEDELLLSPLDIDSVIHNHNIVREHFSAAKLKNDLECIFNR